MRRYLFNTLSGIVTLYVVFLLLFYGAKGIGGAALETGDSLEGLVVGYTIWMLAIFAFQNMAWGVSNEAMVGTLEQLYLSRAGFAWVNASVMAASALTNLVLIGAVTVLMMATTGQWLNLDLISIIPVALLTISAGYGVGFAMAGLALVFKRIQSAFQILTFGFIGCLAVPLDRFPWAKFLPLALGNKLLRAVMVDGQRLWELPAGDVALAAAVGLGYFLLGLAAFAYLLKVARDQGLMGQY